MKKIGFRKVGAAHLEMIISFIFFMGFIFFLFVTLKPYDTTTLSSSVTVGLYNSFEEETHTNLTNLFLKANYTGDNSCFYIQLPDNISKYALTESLVKDVSNVTVNSELGGNNLEIGSNEVFYRVSISPEFSDNDLNECEKLSEYSLGSLVERRVTSYSSLINMSGRYAEEYDNLKEELGVPKIFDFGIVCEELPEINMELLIPPSEEVIAQDYVLEVLKDTGEVINVIVTIKVW